ncbi:MAG: hypothetical protein JWM07_61 [Candidatus Saccharibacteria bacterium]|nr:hypothetical protein [Candidatus Saccharibacteria bacterium]
MQENSLLGFLMGILVIGALLVAVMILTRKGATQLDVNKYRLKWMAIEKQLNKDDQSGCVLAVLNADKLLDQALRERGVKGQTMGERMKAAKDTWSNANAVWGAHKLRNQIAHESDHHLSFDDARRAIAGFKQALKDIGAI